MRHPPKTAAVLNPGSIRGVQASLHAHAHIGQSTTALLLPVMFTKRETVLRSAGIWMTCLHKGGKQAMLKGGCKAGSAGCYLCTARAELIGCHFCLFTQARQTRTHQWDGRISSNRGTQKGTQKAPIDQRHMAPCAQATELGLRQGDVRHAVAGSAGQEVRLACSETELHGIKFLGQHAGKGQRAMMRTCTSMFDRSNVSGISSRLAGSE